MVNVKNLFGMAVMASALVACSSNDDVNPNPNPQGGEVGYATFCINLPQVSGTRADATPGTPEVNPGVASEYKVTKATALIFQKFGNSEGESRFVESVDLTNLDFKNDNESGITQSSSKLVAKLTNVDTKNQYYVLVILNNNNTVILPTNGQTYSQWNNTVRELDAKKWSTDNTEGFYMANATLLNGATTQTLAEIKSDKIYATEAAAKAAENDPAATVYVERGVAKVNVKQPGTDGSVAVKDKANPNTLTGDNVKFEKWDLDVTNKKTYAVHNVDGLTASYSDIWTVDRFKGTNNRVYWGIDPNYNTANMNSEDTDGDNLRLNNFNYLNGIETGYDYSTTDNVYPAYCLENTFDLSNMYQGQTTRVVFRAKYTPKTQADVNFGADDDGTFYTIGNMSTIYSTKGLKAAIESAAKAELGSTTFTVDIDDFKNSTSNNVRFVSVANLKDSEGNIFTTSGTYNGKTGSQIVANINAALGLKTTGRSEDMVGINAYVKGETYYVARIKHFNELTPWASGESYGSDNAKYLGRYGMLRNNWYELSIGNVFGPGYPSVPPVDPGTPDDENEKYLSVSVKILDWAKRSQTVDL